MPFALLRIHPSAFLFWLQDYHRKLEDDCNSQEARRMQMLRFEVVEGFWTVSGGFHELEATLVFSIHTYALSQAIKRVFRASKMMNR